MPASASACHVSKQRLGHHGDCVYYHVKYGYLLLGRELLQALLQLHFGSVLGGEHVLVSVALLQLVLPQLLGLHGVQLLRVVARVGRRRGRRRRSGRVGGRDTAPFLHAQPHGQLLGRLALLLVCLHLLGRDGLVVLGGGVLCLLAELGVVGLDGLRPLLLPAVALARLGSGGSAVPRSVLVAFLFLIFLIFFAAYRVALFSFLVVVAAARLGFGQLNRGPQSSDRVRLGLG